MRPLGFIGDIILVHVLFLIRFYSRPVPPDVTSRTEEVLLVVWVVKVLGRRHEAVHLELTGLWGRVRLHHRRLTRGPGGRTVQRQPATYPTVSPATNATHTPRTHRTD